MNMWAGAIAKRIGLIKTMVFTHLPSAIFLALLPVPTSLSWTIVLLFARASLNSMDQAPRSAFIAAVVRPEERTAVMGIVNVVKILAQSGGPSVTGILAENNLFWVAFLLAGSFKVCYDLGLLTLFVNTKLHKHEGGKEEVSLSKDEEDLAELLDESEYETGSEEEAALHKDIKIAKRPSPPRKSFSFPSGKSKAGKIGEDNSATSSEVDVTSPKGHKRTESFPLKEVR
jgi:MFS family permease